MHRPARTFVLPVPLSRMVAPYATILGTAAGHRHRESNTGYERHRGAELEAQAGGSLPWALPGDEAAMKLLYLVLNNAAQQWKRAPREWVEAKTQFAVIFGERFSNNEQASGTEFLTVPPWRQPRRRNVSAIGTVGINVAWTVWQSIGTSLAIVDIGRRHRDLLDKGRIGVDMPLEVMNSGAALMLYPMALVIILTGRRDDCRIDKRPGLHLDRFGLELAGDLVEQGLVQTKADKSFSKTHGRRSLRCRLRR